MVQIGSDCQPMNTITSFFTNIRHAVTVALIEREIYNRIAAHVNGEKNYGYPFDSLDELEAYCRDSGLEAVPFLQDIEKYIVRMPKAYGLAFRYILHRDLKTRGTMPEARIQIYKMLARRRIYPTTCDPRFVATRA